MEKKDINIRICLGSSCYSRGNAENLQIIKNFIATNAIACDIDFRGHLCAELCTKGPVVEIGEHKYFEVTPNQIEKILASEFKQLVFRRDQK